MAKRRAESDHGQVDREICQGGGGRLRRRGDLASARGRPTIGSGPATVESVRLDPELREALAVRARRDDEATSSVIRKALRQYLTTG